jgi:hypothetical protein
MVPKYSGRLFDRLILIVVKQTAGVKHNPDDTEYPKTRAEVLRDTAKALWRMRDELQAWRREGCKVEPTNSEG